MSTVGPAVPFILIPRFTSYVGPGTYTTVPLETSRFAGAEVTVWRGPLVGDTGAGAGFELWVEGSHDANEWSRVAPPLPSPVISTPNTFDQLSVPTTYKWLRAHVDLAADTSDVVAITIWITGILNLRVQ